MTPTQLDGDRCFEKLGNGESAETIRNGDGSCDDWLRNNQAACRGHGKLADSGQWHMVNVHPAT